MIFGIKTKNWGIAIVALLLAIGSTFETHAQTNHHYYWLTFEVVNTQDLTATKSGELQNAMLGHFGVQYVDVNLNNNRVNVVLQDNPKRVGYDSFKNRLYEIFGIHVLKVNLLRDVKYDVESDPLQVFAKPVNDTPPPADPALQFVPVNSD